MKMNKIVLAMCSGLFLGCTENNFDNSYDEEIAQPQVQNEEVENPSDTESEFSVNQEYNGSTSIQKLCDGNIISPEAAEKMLELTMVTEYEDAYSIYDRIDGIASLFEDCADPWGLFPTTYRQITARGLQAIENGEFEDEGWAQDIIVDFAGRYLENLQMALVGEQPSWAWEQYYYLADREDVSKTRAVLVAMCAHLMLDLPHSLVAIETTEANKNDFFVFGEMMIEVSDELIIDLRKYHNTDAEDILNGFFFGEWVDGVFGANSMITLSYQTIRTKSWNNRWYLEQSWGKSIADAEIYSSFWMTDGVLASLDAAGIID